LTLAGASPNWESGWAWRGMHELSSRSEIAYRWPCWLGGLEKHRLSKLRCLSGRRQAQTCSLGVWWDAWL
jgi:hypothetical protein